MQDTSSEISCISSKTCYLLIFFRTAAFIHNFPFTHGPPYTYSIISSSTCFALSN